MFRQLIAAAFATLLALSAFSAQAAVDVNQATQADLETVKGIGPGLSGKILKARAEGPFKNWNDLVDRVGGIGAGNAGKFSEAGLTVGGAAYDKAAAPAPAAQSGKTAKDPAALQAQQEAKAAKKAEKAAKAKKAGDAA